MKETASNSRYALILISREEAAPAVHPLEEAARIAGMHPARLRHYCRLGIFGPALADPAREPAFDDDQLYELRRFEHFRQRMRLHPAALRLLCELWRKVEHLEAELRFFRDR